MEKKPKYIPDAICYQRFYGHGGYWLRIRDLNYLEDKDCYTPAARGGAPLVLIHDVYPYEEWMEEYIGTSKNLPGDERLQYKKDDKDYCSDCVNVKGCLNCVNGELKETLAGEPISSLGDFRMELEKSFDRYTNENVCNMPYASRKDWIASVIDELIELLTDNRNFDVNGMWSDFFTQNAINMDVKMRDIYKQGVLDALKCIRNRNTIKSGVQVDSIKSNHKKEQFNKIIDQLEAGLQIIIAGNSLICDFFRIITDNGTTKDKNN